MTPKLPVAPGEDDERKGLPEMSMEEIVEFIAGDVHEGPNSTQNPAIIDVAISLQIAHQQGELSAERIQEVLRRFNGAEEQVEILRSLQSLIGRGPLIQAISRRIDMSPMEILEELSQPTLRLGESADVEVSTAFQRLIVLKFMERLDKKSIEKEIGTLKTMKQKRALIYMLKNEIGEDELIKILGS